MVDASWFPRWTGQKCVVVASGPSASLVHLERGRGRVRCIATNDSWKLAPWADVLYACDKAWWDAKSPDTFAGLRVAWRGSWDGAALPEGLHGVEVVNEAAPEEMSVATPGVIGGGGGSGFQAINLAVQFGARSIAMVGLDATLAGGSHWHGDHKLGLGNPLPETVRVWKERLEAAAPALERYGVELVNCSDVSAVEVYQKMTFEEWLER